MQIIQNVKTLEGEKRDFLLAGDPSITLNVEGKLTAIPALIEPFFELSSREPIDHFPFQEIFKGGCSTLLLQQAQEERGETFRQKKEKLDKLLNHLSPSLQTAFYAYVGMEEIEKLGRGFKDSVGVFLEEKSFDLKRAEKIFSLAAQENVVVALEAHSDVDRAIHLAEKYGARLLLLNVSTPEQIELIQRGRERSLLLYAHINTDFIALDLLESPMEEAHFPATLPKTSERKFIWQAIQEQLIDLIGTGRFLTYLTPSSRGEWRKIDPISLTFPLLWSAYQQKKIGLEQLIDISRGNIFHFFSGIKNHDTLLFAPEESRQIRVEMALQKPQQITLVGWPHYILRENHAYALEEEKRS